MDLPYLDSRTPLVDGLTGCTGAWSVSRALAAGQNGPIFDAQAVRLYDQSGQGGSNINSGGTVPALTVSGPRQRRALRFLTGTTAAMAFGSGEAVNKYVTASAGFIVMGVMFHGFTGGAAFYQNDGMIADTGGYFGLMAATVGGGSFQAGVYDGGAKNADQAVATGIPYVVSWRLDSGTLYATANLAESSVACGNIQVSSNNMQIGAGFSGVCANFTLFELIMFNVVPNAGQRARLINDMGKWIGAGV